MERKHHIYYSLSLQCTAKWQVQGTYSFSLSAIRLINEHSIDQQSDPIIKDMPFSLSLSLPLPYGRSMAEKKERERHGMPLPHLKCSLHLGKQCSEVVSRCLPQSPRQSPPTTRAACLRLVYILKLAGTNTASHSNTDQHHTRVYIDVVKPTETRTTALGGCKPGCR